MENFGVEALSLSEDQSDTFRWRNCQNIAGAFCEIKGFDERYVEVLTIAIYAKEHSLTEEYLDQDMKKDLSLSYENDCCLAMLKFDAFAHCMFIEEALRLSKPLFAQSPIEVIKIKPTCWSLTFQVKQDFNLMDNSVVVFRTKELQDIGSRSVYIGDVNIIRSKRQWVVKVKTRQGDPPILHDMNYTVFEKPMENMFESWTHMTRIFREKPSIAGKVFGPRIFDDEATYDMFLEKRESMKKILYRNETTSFFNDEQKNAVFSMVAQDPRNTFILYGPPGTGKTTTLVEGIRGILATYVPYDDQSTVPRFLVCTPSNSAADAFALALIERDIVPVKSIFRAMSSRYDPTIRDIRLKQIVVVDNAGNYSMPESKVQLQSFQVVISTIGYCSALRSIGKDFFTHIIVDEAGQCLEPETLIPLAYFGREDTRVILAGDPQQLGPVVTSDFLCGKYGTHMSCLLRLAEQPSYQNDDRLMVQLRDNHRSHGFIVNCASNLFYKGTLRHTEPPGHDSLCNSPILDGNPLPVKFYGVYGKEIDTNPSYYNDDEINAVQHYVYKCFSNDLKPSEIGIVCPYRENIRLLKQRFKAYPDMTIDTVEGFQGSERRVIIFTTVRTSALGFLNEYRRFNTAITRAKQMLIVIGNPKLLLKDQTWRRFLHLLYMHDCFDPGTTNDNERRKWEEYFNDPNFLSTI